MIDRRAIYVDSLLADEGITADQCGCLWAFRLGMSHGARHLLGCLHTSEIDVSVIAATYRNPNIEIMRWN